MSETACILEHDPPVEALTGLLCGKHFSRLRSSLVELPAVATWLEVNLAAGGHAGGEKVGGTREDPIPLRQDVLDLIGPDSRKFVEDTQPPTFLLWEDGLVIGEYPSWQAAQSARADEMSLAGVEPDIVRALTTRMTSDDLAELLAGINRDKFAAARQRWQIRPTVRGGCDQAGVDSLRATVMHWSRIVNEEGNHPWPDRNDLIGLVSYLASHLSWIAHQSWVDEFAEEIRKATSQAHRVAPWRPEYVQVSGACEDCGVGAIVANLGEGWRRCEARAGGCGKRADLSEYEYRALLPETRRAG